MKRVTDRMGRRWLCTVALWICPLACAQSPLVVTVGVRTCSVSSSVAPSRATLVPTYSSLPYAGSSGSTIMGSMQLPPGTSSTSPIASISTASSAGQSSPFYVADSSYAQSSPASQTIVPIPIPSYTSGDNLTSTDGNPYLYERDTALSGTTIDGAASRLRKRQDPDQYRPLFDCLEQCDDTEACVAITLLGQSCLLYAAVESATFVLGAQAALNLERFTGYEEPIPTSSEAMPYSSPSMDNGTPQTSQAPYSTPYLAPTGASSLASSRPPLVPSSSRANAASSMPSLMDVSQSEAYSTPMLSTEHATIYTSPPSATSVGSTILPVTLSIPSSSLLSRSSSPSTSQMTAPSSRTMMTASPSTATVSSRSESPLVSATSSNMPVPPSSGSSMLPSGADMPASSAVPPGDSSDVAQESSTFVQAPTASMEASETGVVVSSSSDTASSIEESASASSSEMPPASYIEPSTSSEEPEESATASSMEELPPTYDSTSRLSQDMTMATTSSSSVAATSSLVLNSPSDPDAYLATTTTSSSLQTSSSSSPMQSSVLSSSSLPVPAEYPTTSTISSSVMQPTSSSSAAQSPTSTSSSSSRAVTPSPSSSTSILALTTSSSSSSPSSSRTSTSNTPSISSRTSSSTSSPSSARLTSTSSPSSSSRISSTSSSSSSSRVSSSTSSSSRSSSSSTRSTVPSATPVRNTGKRGLCYTDDQLTLGYSLSGQNSQVSWGYNYFYQNNTSVNSSGINPALTFVPLLFNDDPNLTNVWPQYAQKAIDEGADSLLGFNEPDLCYPGSACMTVNQSVIAWRSFMEPFAGKARLGAPAVTNGGPPSSLQWLGEFMGNCTDCTIDFVPLHWYSSIYAFSYLQYYVQLAYNMTQKPIWVTEFGIDSSGGSEAQYQAFLQMALPWLDAVPYVERYAYFYDGPGYLINANGSRLSAQGMIYNSYTAPCPNWQNSEGHC